MANELPSGAARFSGEVVAHYDASLGNLFFEPYAIEIAERIKNFKTQTVLELASGTGRVTNHLRKTLPAETILIASDISEDMLSFAKEKLKYENIEWQLIDAEELPFENNSIDLVVCCFGYMFVPDKIKAFKEAKRVLNKNGKLVFTTWDKMELNGASNVYRKAVKRYLGNDLPDSYKLPFSMNDEAEIKRLLNEAGFTNTEVERVAKTSVSKTAAAAANGLTRGGSIYNDLMKINPQWVEEIHFEVEKELIEKFGEAPMIAPMSALVIEAVK